MSKSIFEDYGGDNFRGTFGNPKSARLVSYWVLWSSTVHNVLRVSQLIDSRIIFAHSAIFTWPSWSTDVSWVGASCIRYDSLQGNWIVQISFLFEIIADSSQVIASYLTRSSWLVANMLSQLIMKMKAVPTSYNYTDFIELAYPNWHNFVNTMYVLALNQTTFISDPSLQLNRDCLGEKQFKALKWVQMNAMCLQTVIAVFV